MNPNRYRDLTVNQATVGSNPTMRASFGPLAQWKSNSFTRRRSAVQPCHGLPYRGHSSVGRAVALQASGLRFDPACLHQNAVRL